MVIVYEDEIELRPEDMGLKYFEEQLEKPRVPCLVFSDEAYARLQKHKLTHIDH